MAQPHAAQPSEDADVQQSLRAAALRLQAAARRHKRNATRERRLAREKQQQLEQLRPLLAQYGLQLIIDGTDEEVTANHEQRAS